VNNKITIITNHTRRPLLLWQELTGKEQKNFHWLETEDERDGALFFRYRTNVYCLDEFMDKASQFKDFKGWDAYKSDSFFSGILIKLVDDGDRVIVGMYYG
jgi:hypothetical protein